MRSSVLVEISDNNVVFFHSFFSLLFLLSFAVTWIFVKMEMR